MPPIHVIVDVPHHLSRDGKRFPRCIFPHNIDFVPYITFIVLWASCVSFKVLCQSQHAMSWSIDVVLKKGQILLKFKNYGTKITDLKIRKPKLHIKYYK